MENISEILEALSRGEITVEAAKSAIESRSIVNISHTRIDLGRRERTGVGEIIYGAGKTPVQICEIAEQMLLHGEGVFVTRIAEDAAKMLLAKFAAARFNALARTVTIGKCAAKKSAGKIAIVTAGTSDMSVAEEARETLAFLGDDVEVFSDCGVAGIHRLMAVIDDIRKCRVAIAIAGMEGALASVLAGLLKSPVIAVPTSVGYGANFGGLAALLAMINSCANGVSIVNIDNGFGAAYDAHLINSI